MNSGSCNVQKQLRDYVEEVEEVDARKRKRMEREER